MNEIHLSNIELHRLQDASRASSERRLRDRIQIILMAHRGRTHVQIAANLGISCRTVSRCLDAYLERGLDGLRPGKAKGATPKLPADLAEEIKTLLTEGPAKQGLDQANWSYAELADHLLKTKGIRVSRSDVGRVCRNMGVRVRRPT
jgi:transposase